jgi:glycosyltransferase involved in cell wall biosynthesis
MRICYLADGRYVHTHRWMRFFAERGHSVHLISFAPLTTDQQTSVAATGAIYHGTHENLHLKRWWLTLRSLRFIKRVLRNEKIDLLHCHFLGANAWYGALSGFHPLVITVMGGDVTGPDWQPARDVRERRLTPLALRRADLITCWSRNLTDVVRRYTRPDVSIEVIHGGVDLERFQPGEKPNYLLERWGLPSDARVIFSPRLMRPLYNLEQIARAAVDVCATDPRAYFLFAYSPVSTDTAYEARVRAVIDEAGISERVKFVGAIPYDEMADHYRLADVVVSVPQTDGTPLSVLEAMACSTPVVVSRIPDYDRDYIEPGATVLDVGTDDATALAQTILTLLCDSDLADRLATEAKQRVDSTGSYYAQMSRMEDLYHSLVSEKHSREA